MVLLRFSPSGTAGQGRTLGVVDFERQEVRHFPDTQFNHASPFVDPASGEVTWGMGAALYRRGPGAGDAAQWVNEIPADLIGARPVQRIATHLTRSADGRSFLVDAQIGMQYVFGSLPIDGGDYVEWQRFERNYNHAQFSPTDPDLVLFAQENHPDPITGLTFPIVDRLWLLRRGERAQPLLPEPTRVTHEWWDADGKHAWCVWGNDTWRVDIHTRQIEKIAFPRHCWHSHASRGGDYIIGDSNERFYRGCPSSVHFLNRHTRQGDHPGGKPGAPGYRGAVVPYRPAPAPVQRRPLCGLYHHHPRRNRPGDRFHPGFDRPHFIKNGRGRRKPSTPAIFFVYPALRHAVWLDHKIGCKFS